MIKVKIVKTSNDAKVQRLMVGGRGMFVSRCAGLTEKLLYKGLGA